MVDPSESRRYDEKEFALILREAASLQARDAARPIGAGLSLREIEGIAAEAGIDPRFVRLALTAVPSGTPGPLARAFGYPYHFHTRQVLPGELGHDQLSTVVDTLQREFGRPGEARDVLGGIEWTARDQFGTMQASVRRAGAETRIHVGADRTETVVVLATLLPIAGLIAGGALVGIIGGLPGIATGVVVANGGVAGLIAARMAWTRVSNRWRQRIDVLLERVAQSVRSPAEGPRQIHRTPDVGRGPASPE